MLLKWEKYLVDGVPNSPTQIIELARELQPNYAEGMLHFVSEAAAVLREYGYTVVENVSEEEYGSGAS